MSTITLPDVIFTLKSQRENLRRDFKDKKHGEKAKLLHKHYTLILRLLEKI